MTHGPFAIVGCGGVGGNLAWLLARLHEREELLLFDGDIVKRKNLKNQPFALRDVKEQPDVPLFKTDVLARDIGQALGGSVRSFPHFVKEQTRLAPVVCLCVDTMEDRRFIMQQCVYPDPRVRLVIESRMDGARCVIYAFDPHITAHRDIWDHYWFPDTQAENDGPACGGPLSVAYTPFMAAALMAETLSMWYADDGQHRLKSANLRWVDLKKNVMDAEWWP